MKRIVKRTSTQNPQIKQIRKLMRLKKEREKHRLFVVEGTQQAAAALQNGWTFRRLLYDPDQPLTPAALAVAQQAPDEARLPVSRAVAAYLSESPKPPELIAVLEQRRIEPPRSAGADSFFLLLDRPRDPGNVGAVIRTADALRIQAVGLVGDAVDLFSPKTVRAAMGSLFSVPAFRLPSAAAAERWIQSLKAERPELTVVGTSPSAETPLDAVDWTVPAAAVIGNERKGVSEGLAAACDLTAAIPMRGSAESLNAAVSASIVMYEADRQRRAAKSPE